jgi:hypothetical protein
MTLAIDITGNRYGLRTALDQEGQQLGASVGGDDDEGVGPHRVPKHLRRKKKAEDPATVEARQRVEEATEAPVARKSIQSAAAPFPRPVEGGVLVTPAMLKQIKQEAARAARLAMEARQLKEGRLVTAARDYADQQAQARAQRLADLAIDAAIEAEYEPAERDQVKEIEIEDPTTGKPFKATIKTKVVA